MSTRKQPKTTSFTARVGGPWFRFAATITVVLALSGCGSSGTGSARQLSENEAAAAVAGRPTELHPYYTALAAGGQTDWVKNQAELGVAALAHGHPRLATEAFDQALAGVEAVYANTEEAANARSLWYEEGSKTFKGEPYERVMVYYYRGLLYAMDGDYDNARACFKGGILQDAFAEDEQFRCDFALMLYLGGWASQKMGDADGAKAFFDELKTFRPDFTPPSPSETLLIVETGKSPRKLADGVGHYQMKLFRGKGFSDVAARVRTESGTSERLYPMEDIALQAMTRGGRPIDAILEGKVAFQKRASRTGSTLSSVGSTAMIGSTLASGGAASGIGYAGAGLSLIGATSSYLAVKARPRADTRYWDNLPDTVHVSGIPASQAAQGFVVEFLDASGAAVASTHVSASASDSLIWVRNPEHH